MGSEPYQVSIEVEWWDACDYDARDVQTDVWVTFPNGLCYSATFVTYQNVATQSLRSQRSGRRLDGRYFLERGLVLVDVVSRQRIEAVIGELLADGEFHAVFRRSLHLSLGKDHPARMQDPHYERYLRLETIGIAKELIYGQTSLIDGVRKVLCLTNELVLTERERWQLLREFLAVDSETRSFPVGPELGRSALAEQRRMLCRQTEREAIYRDEVVRAAKRLIDALEAEEATG